MRKPDATRFRDTLLALPVGWQRSAQGLHTEATGKRKLSARAVQFHLTNVRRLFRWLIDEGRVSRRDNPFDGVGVAHAQSPHKRAPTEQEAAALTELPKPDAIDADTWRMMPCLVANRR